MIINISIKPITTRAEAIIKRHIETFKKLPRVPMMKVTLKSREEEKPYLLFLSLSISPTSLLKRQYSRMGMTDLPYDKKMERGITNKIHSQLKKLGVDKNEVMIEVKNGRRN